MFRQNLVLFAGGLVAGFGSFVFHAIAGRMLGPAAYGQVAFLIAVYAVGATLAVVVSLLVARHTSRMVARGDSAIVRSLITAAMPPIGIACVLALLVTALLARSVAAFEHIRSSVPVLLLGLCVAMGWQVALPRGILQGLQRFRALALNFALEPVVRVGALVLLLISGYSVSGAIAALFAGLGFCLLIGFYSLRDTFAPGGPPARLRVMAGFSVTAVAGIVGIQLLFNQDVILAEHYLPSHLGGIYGGLNKIGTILFYLTLSVSQVLFPRVVEAVEKDHHPGRILLSSVGIVAALGAGALLIFAWLPGLVVAVLYGASFRDATPYVLAVGVIGLALSLNNLLVQFFMAVHDLWFVPILAAGCIGEAALIVLFHATLWHVVADVLAALVGLLILLSVRCYLLLPTLRAGAGARPEPSL